MKRALAPRRDPRILLAVGLVWGVVGIGAMWFWLVEDFGLINAFYQAVITVSTVGFAETEPLDRSGRLFTIVLIVFGVGILLYALSTFVETAMETATTRLATRRKERTMDRLSNHTIICGYGETGKTAAALLPGSVMVGVIEVSDDRAGAALADGYPALAGDCTLEETLEAAGIRRAQRLLVCVPSDSDAISTVLSARVMNPDLQILVRATAAGSEGKLMTAGANRVVSPLQMGARRLVAEALEPGVADFFDIALHDHDVDVTLRSVSVESDMPVAGSDVGEVEVRFGVRLLAVRTEGRVSMLSSLDEVNICRGQVLTVMGPDEAVEAFRHAVRSVS